MTAPSRLLLPPHFTIQHTRVSTQARARPPPVQGSEGQSRSLKATSACVHALGDGAARPFLPQLKQPSPTDAV